MAAGKAPLVAPGDRIAADQALTTGPRDPPALLALVGRDATAAYLVEAIAGVYRAESFSAG